MSSPPLQPRRVARELALLGISQLSSKPEKLEETALQDIVLAAVRVLTAEAREALEAAAAELQRGHERLGRSRLQSAKDLEKAGALVQESIDLAQGAIERLGSAVDLPEMLQVAGQLHVRDYALEIVRTVNRQRDSIDGEIAASLVDWQIDRLARIDRDILRIAVAEMHYLGLPPQIAINEAVELAKRYSEDDGYRFVNGVLRRASQRQRAAARAGKAGAGQAGD